MLRHRWTEIYLCYFFTKIEVKIGINMGTIEGILNDALRRYPSLRKGIKKVYQRTMCLMHTGKRSIGDIERVSPKNEECFFGYYDKSPWDITGQYMLALRVEDASKNVAPSVAAEILLLDTYNENAVRVLGKTNTWNVQQGCMLQWLGPAYRDEIIYNDFRDGKYCSIVLELSTGNQRVLDIPVYAVDNSGEFALSLDFSRLHRLRPGYGYSNLPDVYSEEVCPDIPCITKINLLTGQTAPIATYKQLCQLKYEESMDGAVHKVNHIMIAPSGKRFMFLHRWLKNGSKYSRLITMNVDGSMPYILNDEHMISHCCWKNDQEILAWERKDELGNHYYLMKDRTEEYKVLWDEELKSDGHPSYSPMGGKIVTDCYPNKFRMASVFIANEENGEVNCIGQVFAPFKYDNETRCDLHPRWNWAGDKICIDAVFEGYRGMYVIPIKNEKRKMRT